MKSATAHSAMVLMNRKMKTDRGVAVFGSDC